MPDIAAKTSETDGAATRIGAAFANFCRTTGQSYDTASFRQWLARTGGFLDAQVWTVYRAGWGGHLSWRAEMGDSQVRYWRVMADRRYFLLPRPANEDRFDSVEGFQCERLQPQSSFRPGSLERCAPGILTSADGRWELAEHREGILKFGLETPQTTIGRPPEDPVQSLQSGLAELNARLNEQIAGISKRLEERCDALERSMHRLQAEWQTMTAKQDRPLSSIPSSSAGGPWPIPPPPAPLAGAATFGSLRDRLAAGGKEKETGNTGAKIITESVEADIRGVEKESARVSALGEFVNDFKGQMAGLENSLKVKNGEQEARLKEFWKSINETLEARLKTSTGSQPAVPSSRSPEPPVVHPPAPPVIVASPTMVLATGEKVPKELSKAESIGLCFVSFCQERRYEFPLGEFLAELKQKFPEALGQICYRPADAHAPILYFQDQKTSAQKYWRVTVNENNFLVPVPIHQHRFDGIEGFDVVAGQFVTPGHLRYCQPALLWRRDESWEVKQRGQLRENPDPELPGSWSEWLSPAKPQTDPAGRRQAAAGTSPVEAGSSQSGNQSPPPASHQEGTVAQTPAAAGSEEKETENTRAESKIDVKLMEERIISGYVIMCRCLHSYVAKKISVTVHFCKRIQEAGFSDEVNIQHATYFPFPGPTRFLIASKSSEFWLATIEASGEQLLFPHYWQLGKTATPKFHDAFRVSPLILPGPNALVDFVPCRVVPAGKDLYSIQRPGEIRFKNDR